MQESAQKMMDGIGYEGIVIDGRRICFEYRSVLLADSCRHHVCGWMR